MNFNEDDLVYVPELIREINILKSGENNSSVKKEIVSSIAEKVAKISLDGKKKFKSLSTYLYNDNELVMNFIRRLFTFEEEHEEQEEPVKLLKLTKNQKKNIKRRMKKKQIENEKSNTSSGRMAFKTNAILD
jgi:hypothetical protein